MASEGHLRYRIGPASALNPEPGAGSAPKVPAWKRRLRRILAGLCVGYLVAVVFLWLLMCGAPTSFWPVHLFVYGPRWVLILPLLVLVPAVLWLYRWLLAPLALAGLVVAGPVMGLCIPWRHWLRGPSEGPRLRILTCNVGGGVFDPEALAQLIRRVRPDVVAFQEFGERKTTGILDEKDGPWHVQAIPGLCLASRYPFQSFSQVHDPALTDYSQMVIAGILAPEGPVTLINLHLVTPRDGLEDLLSSRWDGIASFRSIMESQRVTSRFAMQEAAQAGPGVIVMGDFNLPVESPIYRATWSRLTDAFTESGFGYGPTKYTRLLRVRIDHVLSGSDWEPVDCWVGPALGGDHRPLIADLVRIRRAPAMSAERGSMPGGPALVLEQPGPGAEPAAPSSSVPQPSAEGGKTDLPAAAAALAPELAPSRPAPESPPIPNPAAGEPPLAGSSRRTLHQDLQTLLTSPSRDKVPEILRLCGIGQGSQPRAVPAALRLAAARLNRRGRVEYYREKGLSESEILRELISEENRSIGARDGPRNFEEAVLRAVRFLLSVPPAES